MERRKMLDASAVLSVLNILKNKVQIGTISEITQKENKINTVLVPT